MSKSADVDELDLKILTILMENAKISYSEIGKRLFVSGGTVHVRMKKMEQAGIVTRHQVVVNYAKLGYDITTFVGIYLRRSVFYEEVVEELKKIPEVVGVHYTTGNYSMFTKIICRDTIHLREVLHDKMQSIRGVQRTETLLSLEESINRPVQLIQMEETELTTH